MDPIRSIFIILSIALIGLADGCSRQASEYTAAASKFPAPTVGPTMTPINLNCTPLEKRSIGCLKGECYAIDLDGRSAYCRCESGFEGVRCEKRSWNLGALRPKEEVMTAQIAGGVAGLLAVVVITIVVSVLIIRWRKKRVSSRNIQLEAPMPENDSAVIDGGESRIPLKNGKSETMNTENELDTSLNDRKPSQDSENESDKSEKTTKCPLLIQQTYPVPRNN